MKKEKLNSVSFNDLHWHLYAIEAKKWLDSDEYQNQLIFDKSNRAKIDIKNGHSPKCSLSKCHSDCPSNK